MASSASNNGLSPQSGRKVNFESTDSLTSNTSSVVGPDVSSDSLAPVTPRHRAISNASTLTTSSTSTNVKRVSARRQADFEKIFSERLLATGGEASRSDDFLVVTQTQSADLQSTILLHGRLYLTRYHLCFRSNILGAVTERIHPLKDVVGIEKGTTAKWIQNAVYVKVDVDGETVHHGYGSMADRDAMYEQAVEWWQLEAPDRYAAFQAAEASGLGAAQSTPTLGPSDAGQVVGEDDSATTGVKETYGTGERLKELAIEAKIPLDLEQTYRLMYHNPEFTKHFYDDVKKLLDVKIGAWEGAPGQEKRQMTYVMPMFNPLGPSKSDCIGIETVVAADAADSYEVDSETQTLDVPSGNKFKVHARTCLSHAEIGGRPATRMHCTTQVNWSGSSLLKSTITPAVIKGQKQHHQQLVDAILAWIDSHREELGKAPDEQVAKVVDRGDPGEAGGVVVDTLISRQKTLVEHAHDIPGNPVMLAISALCALLLILQLWQ